MEKKSVWVPFLKTLFVCFCDGSYNSRIINRVIKIARVRNGYFIIFLGDLTNVSNSGVKKLQVNVSKGFLTLFCGL